MNAKNWMMCLVILLAGTLCWAADGDEESGRGDKAAARQRRQRGERRDRARMRQRMLEGLDITEQEAEKLRAIVVEARGQGDRGDLVQAVRKAHGALRKAHKEGDEEAVAKARKALDALHEKRQGRVEEIREKVVELLGKERAEQIMRVLPMARRNGRAQPGRGAMDAIRDSLTDEQKVILEEARKNAENAKTPQAKREAFRKGMEQLRETLTKQQKEMIRKQTQTRAQRRMGSRRGRGLRETIGEVLTDEQKAVMKTAFDKAAKAETFEEKREILQEAKEKVRDSMTDEQREQIRQRLRNRMQERKGRGNGEGEGPRGGRRKGRRSGRGQGARGSGRPGR
jgi:hypothetical protein